jgi:hypothetical protein
VLCTDDAFCWATHSVIRNICGRWLIYALSFLHKELYTHKRSDQHFWESESLCIWQSVSRFVLASSPSGAHDQIFIFIVNVTVLSIWGALPWREVGSVACQSVVGSRSLVSIYIQTVYLQQLIKTLIYNIYKAFVRPGSVQQIMPYY